MILHIFCVLLLIGSIKSENCTTPNNENAVCVPLTECKVLYQAFTHQNATILEFIRQSQCEPLSNISSPSICCGSFAYFTGNVPLNAHFKDEIRNSSHKQSETDKDSKNFNHFDNITETIIEELSLPECGYQRFKTTLDKTAFASIYDFPWFALLIYEEDDDLLKPHHQDFYEKYICAGSLINQRYVLTAAQCLRLRSSAVTEVRLGELDLGKEKDCMQTNASWCNNFVEDVGIEEKIPHPNYNRKLGLHDIALLRLDRTVNFTDFIRPICLPASIMVPISAGDILLTSGFGRLRKNLLASRIKKKTITKAITSEQCNEEISSLMYRRRNVHENVLCTKDVNKGSSVTCEGDSGAPLMYIHQNRTYLGGIFVWGVNVCGPEYPSVFTKVANYLSWIKESIRP